MVIIYLSGGLGNQMFHYASARGVASTRGGDLRLDVRAFAADPKRCYQLSAWKIRERFASAADVLALRMKDKIDRVARPSAPWYRRHFLVEPASPFFPEVLREAPRSCAMTGLWQSERYWQHIEPQIREEFTPREPLSAPSRAAADRIRACASVSVHIRRGDYVTDPKTVASHGSCSMDYYRAATRHILERVSGVRFFVFSDEPEWARANLDLGAPITVVDHNPPGSGERPGREHEDMWLMSLCRHAVIANSSFSWWGAWLNPEGKRIVVAPRRWTVNPIYDSPDRIPARWITM